MLTFMIIARAIVKLLRGRRVTDEQIETMTEEHLNEHLDAQAAERGGDVGNHRESVVDLFKLVGLQHDLPARKTLAQDLGYEGPLDGSAEMNIWLNKRVRELIRAGHFKLGCY